MNNDVNELVSAIITTYKRDYMVLKRAIDSVINQSYKDIEIIVINDYPEKCDNNYFLKKMVDDYKKDGVNIKYVVVEKNGGACKARNFGIKLSKGNYIGFLDDDDEWLENKVTKMVQKFKECPCAAIVYSNAIIYNEDNNKSRILHKDIKPSGNIYNYLFISNLIGSNSFPLHKREILEKYKGFNENIPAMQDYELYLRICKENDVAYINESLSKYHVYQGDRITKNAPNRVKAYEMIYDEFKDDIENNKECRYFFNRRGIDVYSVNSNYYKALKCWLKTIKNKPTKVKNNTKDLFKIVIRLFYKKTNK